MRVLTCVAFGHDWRFVVAAALMCMAGSLVAISLFNRTLQDRGPSRYHWCFLAAVAAGAATWATHFIAMLGYQVGVPVDFDGPLTVGSTVIAVGGFGAGLLMTATLPRRLAVLLGGFAIGTAIATMHYVGMFAYRVDGCVQWEATYLVASLVASIVLSMLMVDRLLSDSRRRLLGA